MPGGARAFLYKTRTFLFLILTLIFCFTRIIHGKGEIPFTNQKLYGGTYERKKSVYMYVDIVAGVCIFWM